MPALPSPAHQVHGLFSQLHSDLMLDLIQLSGEQEQIRQSQSQVFVEAADLVSEIFWRIVLQLDQQMDNGFQLALTRWTVQNALSARSP